MAIIPEEGKVYASANGKITALFPTGHAIGITTTEGIEILIHVGMDTVSLDGKGFSPQVKLDDEVIQGQLLLNFDIDVIQEAGLEIVTPVVITNYANYESVEVLAEGNITEATSLLSVK